MHLRIGIIAAVSLSAPLGVLAQAPAVTRAAGSITEADVRARVGIIAHDSMGGRNTPSPGLTRTANYIAGEFKRLGLKPGGDAGTYLMKYPIQQRKLLAAESFVTFTSPGGQTVKLSFARDAALTGRGLPLADGRAPLTLVGGAGRLDSLPAPDLRGRLLMFVTDWNRADASSRLVQLSRAASRAGALGVVAVVNSDSVYTARYGSAADRLFEVAAGDRSGFFNLAVRESAIAAQFPGATAQLAALRDAAAVSAQPAPNSEGVIALRDTVVTEVFAPNVVGILEGSDPALKHEYLVYSAHMDHVGTAGQPGAGCRALGADSICNGADDDASGTAGVLELAEAFAQRGARPRRSVVFLTVSGEEHGLWGSEWFVNHPPVPLPQIVANLNADMIGRNWTDTIVAIGKEHSDLGATLNRVNRAHPELRMNAIDDRWPEQNFYGRSDHYNFARKGVPILFFFNGVHAEYHRPGDSVEKIDAEKEARIVKLLFYVGQDVANAAKRPEWMPMSYKSIVTP
jgi:hypothetical protein